MSIEGVIFDADGTLLDSMGIWENLGERYLRKRGISPEKELSEILYPMTMPESCVYLRVNYGISDPPEKIQLDLLNLLKDYYLQEVQLKAGVSDFLGFLKKRGIPMMVASSNDVYLLQGCFQRLGIAEYLTTVLSASDLNLGKTNPRFYLSAASQLGTEPQNTLVFEDALFALLAAKSAGMKTAAISDPSNSQDREELQKEAHVMIRDFTDPVLLKLEEM